MSLKIVFLDLEGTLFEAGLMEDVHGNTRTFNNLWAMLMHRLGSRAVEVEEMNLERWKNGEYPHYVEWVEESLRVLQQEGLTREIFWDVLERIPLAEGAREAIETFHKRGMRTAIISGGFYPHAREAQRRLGIDHALAAVDPIWDQKGALADWNTLPCDYAGKAAFGEVLLKELGVPWTQSGFIGDGKNDRQLAGKAARSVAYRAHPELRAVADYRTNSLSEAAEFLLNGPESSRGKEE